MLEGLGQLFAPGSTTVVVNPFLLLFAPLDSDPSGFRGATYTSNLRIPVEVFNTQITRDIEPIRNRLPTTQTREYALAFFRVLNAPCPSTSRPDCFANIAVRETATNRAGGHQTLSGNRNGF